MSKAPLTPFDPNSKPRELPDATAEKWMPKEWPHAKLIEVVKKRDTAYRAAVARRLEAEERFVTEHGHHTRLIVAGSILVGVGIGYASFPIALAVSLLACLVLSVVWFRAHRLLVAADRALEEADAAYRQAFDEANRTFEEQEKGYGEVDPNRPNPIVRGPNAKLA